MSYTTFLTSIVKNKNIKKNNHIYLFKDHMQKFFLYIIIEKIIYEKKCNNIKVINQLSVYYMYIYWSIIINKVIKSKSNIDSIMRYFTALFIVKIKLNIFIESQSINYFNSYSFFYNTHIIYNKGIEPIINMNKNASSKEDNYFYRKKINFFFTSEFFEIVGENSLILCNHTNNYISLNIKGNLKKNKFAYFNNNKYMPIAFINIIKEDIYTTKEYKTKVKFKRLIKFGLKLKQKNTFYINRPYSCNFDKKKIIFKKKTFKKKIDTNIFKKSVSRQNSFIYKLTSNQFNATYNPISSTQQVKKRVSILTQSNFSFYKLNALSITRFEFEINRNKELKSKQIMIKKKKSAEFLNQLERKIESRYRYVAIYVKDLVRITFFCRYLKKADFIANFYAFLLSKLPRKRKETKLINFFVTILKVFSAQRIERIAVRLRFQGRLNRWRRTKNITGQKGYLEYYSYKSRIEFGIGQAITRKGTQGIRIWLCYNSYFKDILKSSILDYRALNRLYTKF